MAMDDTDEEKTVGLDKARAATCARCQMTVARYAPQVDANQTIYHRECYEAWYYGRYGRRPSLTAGTALGDRHRLTVRETKGHTT